MQNDQHQDIRDAHLCSPGNCVQGRPYTIEKWRVSINIDRSVAMADVD